MKKLLLALLLIPSIAFAHSYKQGDIQIGHAWARATAKGAANGAVYIPFLNEGKEADALVSITTPAAESVMIHNTVSEKGVQKMQHVEKLELPPMKPVGMRPGGLHIMLMGLKQPLVEGEKFPMTLTFEKAGKLDVDVMVHAAGATSPGH